MADNWYEEAKRAAYIKYAKSGKTLEAKEDYNKELIAIRKEWAKMRSN